MSSLPKANFQYKSTHDADLVAIGSYGSDAQIAQYYRTQREQVLKEASGKLSKKKELEVLAQFVQAGTVSESDVFARVLRSAEAVRERMESGASKSSFNTFILHFKHYTSTIDRAVQHHAEGASLVWSSVGFMFDVYCNHLKNESELPKALSQALISLMLGERYMRAYILADSSSSAYRSDLDTVNSHWNAATSTALSELYNAVLILCVKAIVYIQGAGKRARVWSAIKPFEEQFHPLITEIHLKKEFLRELAFLSYLPAHRLHTTGSEHTSSTEYLYVFCVNYV
ncbi:hypothetical protein BJ508DRAFT_8504 [Ascobolus immersus RN42]|uniref:DUF7708 domain-containing protein n=1 Tax=Ascobolus immersus RN42 TaxID=1160509 RepID=A0A3N4HWS2_ASCIM|nr:hypothetical protein BJ508DRAFT_8504 [Ascobolus immersus RN42]